MFRASICPSSGVLGCIRIILLHMVSSTRCCGWDSEEPVCSHVHCMYLHTVHKTTHRSTGPQLQHLVLNTICSSIQPIHSWRLACRCPKHVELFMIINQIVASSWYLSSVPLLPSKKLTRYIEGNLTVKCNRIILHDMSELVDFRILDYLYVTHHTEIQSNLLSYHETSNISYSFRFTSV